jgi:pyruvate dehydrogenase E1 component alpha subunit
VADDADDADGSADGDVHRLVGVRGLADTWLDADDARAAFRDLVRARRFDERALALQRRGWMSGYPPHAGEEATGVGAVHAMRTRDWLVPYYRSNAAQVARGVPMSDLLLFRRGYPEFHSGADRRVLPQAVPIATHLPHATGLAMAAAREGDEAVVAHFGDGATSEGDFHEAVTAAGAFDAPVVFCCENNGWAISVPTDRQTAAPSIAAKADAYGVDGRRVDGNDPLAVREVVTDALAAAREGTPTLVEALTHRRGPHTTADDPNRYRGATTDLPGWRTADPVDRLEAFCLDEGVLDGDDVEAIRAAADEEVREAVATAEAAPDPDPDDLFAHVFADAGRPGAYPHVDRMRAAVRDRAAREDRDGRRVGEE